VCATAWVGRLVINAADRAQLAALVHRYGHYADRRDFTALVALFTDDAVLVLPDPPARLEPVRIFAGREEISGSMWPLLDVPVTLHGLLGLVFEGDDDGDAATGSIAAVAHHLSDRLDGTTSDLVWHLHYADTYRRVADDGWLIAKRCLQIDWIETRPVRRRRSAREPRS
jgi:hypothetical protein